MQALKCKPLVFFTFRIFQRSMSPLRQLPPWECIRGPRSHCIQSFPVAWRHTRSWFRPHDSARPCWELGQLEHDLCEREKYFITLYIEQNIEIKCVFRKHGIKVCLHLVALLAVLEPPWLAQLVSLKFQKQSTKPARLRAIEVHCVSTKSPLPFRVRAERRELLWGWGWGPLKCD